MGYFMNIFIFVHIVNEYKHACGHIVFANFVQIVLDKNILHEKIGYKNENKMQIYMMKFYLITKKLYK